MLYPVALVVVYAVLRGHPPLEAAEKQSTVVWKHWLLVQVSTVHPLWSLQSVLVQHWQLLVTTQAPVVALQA
jgi:hypothetical protein